MPRPLVFLVSPRNDRFATPAEFGWWYHCFRCPGRAPLSGPFAALVDATDEARRHVDRRHP